ncbi:DUF294 nucleotidyltransferase-like domain-containing protein [Mesorhizobium xinjiangense]|uniref:DUF294 nucleotidyltransferase-like domain-containing protein n=1 Tax=Mesorhizobium xinjiangense TaxID=2678685 RepID=UPI0012ED6A80|nr:DUF294 nucleotidyltransferase-like domain-containing protein [Mesorhizobium xinjiangense]
MRRVNGATPLMALDAVAVDTETTGLDTAVARIVQIGAVPVSKGTIDENDRFESLVDPRIAIPAASTAIHHITNAMVRNAPSFAEVWADFTAYAGERLLIGYSIGFDLAVMQREAERAGLQWSKPRTLCVRLLTAIANPHLPDPSLETIAAWLGIAIEGRHDALGDARAAADIFLALIPRLKERGIRTLAEAERGCLQLTGQLENHHRAGWSEPVSRPGSGVLGQVDPFAYRHRIGELMSTPPVVVADSRTMHAVMKVMSERRISAVFTSSSGQTGGRIGDYGIVTERDMMRRIAAAGAETLSRPVGDFASHPLASIRAAAFVYRAVGRMDRLKIRHLAVRDEDDRLIGMISARDLLRLRAGAAISLDDEIEAAASPEEMAAAWATLPSVADSLIAEKIEARRIAGIVSEELRSLTRRAAQLAEAEMEGEGRGAPPCPYAVLVLGSGGRGESLLAADQDNAIVFAEGEPGGAEDVWFGALGEKIASMLDLAGVPLCKGGVMARNAEWRGSSALWHERIDEWVRRSRPEDLLNVDIFFDLMPIHGAGALGQDLFAHAYAVGADTVHFAKMLGERVSARSSPFTMLGGLQSEDGRIDLKMHGLFPIVAAARALAIRHGVAAHSTAKRLDGLITLDIGADTDLEDMRTGHGFLLGLMLRQQSEDLQSGIAVSNRVALRRLSRDEHARLKSVLRQVQNVPMLMRDLMFG